MAGNVSLRLGSTEIPTVSLPSWFVIEDTCVLDVAMVTFASESIFLIWRYILCTMDSYSPSSFLKILMNCLERISLDNGHSLFPEPPDNRIMFICFFLLLKNACSIYYRHFCFIFLLSLDSLRSLHKKASGLL